MEVRLSACAFKIPDLGSRVPYLELHVYQEEETVFSLWRGRQSEIKKTMTKIQESFEIVYPCIFQFTVEFIVKSTLHLGAFILFLFK